MATRHVNSGESVDKTLTVPRVCPDHGILREITRESFDEDHLLGVNGVGRCRDRVKILHALDVVIHQGRCLRREDRSERHER